LSGIRTSPDHGTAFEIAGKGDANPSSFKEAIFTGLEVFKTRSLYKRLMENRLKFKKTR
jgi:4-hydroxy-L-threonine phosphate dehydrogenase PdxA